MFQVGDVIRPIPVAYYSTSEQCVAAAAYANDYQKYTINKAFCLSSLGLVNGKS